VAQSTQVVVVEAPAAQAGRVVQAELVEPGIMLQLHGIINIFTGIMKYNIIVTVVAGITFMEVIGFGI
jgi:hypothetical protein